MVVTQACSGPGAARQAPEAMAKAAGRPQAFFDHEIVRPLSSPWWCRRRAEQGGLRRVLAASCPASPPRVLKTWRAGRWRLHPPSPAPAWPPSQPACAQPGAAGSIDQMSRACAGVFTETCRSTATAPSTSSAPATRLACPTRSGSRRATAACAAPVSPSRSRRHLRLNASCPSANDALSLCVSGSYCAAGPGGTATCQPLITTVGAACAGSRQCAPPLYCKHDPMSVSGVCAQPSPPGAACHPSADEGSLSCERCSPSVIPRRDLRGARPRRWIVRRLVGLHAGRDVRCRNASHLRPATPGSATPARPRRTGCLPTLASDPADAITALRPLSPGDAAEPLSNRRSECAPGWPHLAAWSGHLDSRRMERDTRRIECPIEGGFVVS